MAELRRRKGDGDAPDATDGDASHAATAAAAAAAPTLVAEAVDELLREKQQQRAAKSEAAAAAANLEPLQLSDSATADSSDHVSKRGLLFVLLIMLADAKSGWVVRWLVCGLLASMRTTTLLLIFLCI